MFIAKRLELTGQKFGKLIVDSFAYVKNNRTFWNCTCDCGNKCVVNGKYLSNGDTRSCGCLNIERIKQMGKNNKKFNKYEITNNIVKVFYSNTNNYFLCDKEDWDTLKEYTWFENEGHYARSRINDKLIFFHDIVMDLYNPSIYKSVDHINRQRNDNRKENLRIVTLAQNMKNKSKYKNNKSGRTGIYPSNTNKGGWYATIQVDKEQKHLGVFNTFEEALEMRRKVEKENKISCEDIND